ncbi:hypothetical protein ACH4VM_39240 [Streptomyces sp. NPDC020792]|uniref:DUF6197 family protein n=1 Tax=Streptomyces sp. NPDC020792 TaxID=3365089 RepID=UPI0037B98330
MTVATAPEAPTLELSADLLVAEIEHYLAARVRTTAHPLVTKTTAELIAEALGTPAAAPAPAPAFTEPPRLLRLLPDWVLSVPLVRQLHGGYGRTVTPAEHLELTALVIERYGWTQGTHRSRSGRRCILGAQAVLYRLGYGDDRTVAAAADHLQDALAARGIHQPYHQWNDDPNRSRDQVLALVREAASAARSTR